MKYEVKFFGCWSDQSVVEEMNKYAELSERELKNKNDDCVNHLILLHNGIVINVFSDNGCPEDNSFTRDYSWVEAELERAYRLGFADGQAIKNKE